MISTLIVDDNKIMREHFQTMIDWQENGFDLVSVANNGISGWQEFNKHQPKLVITDVQMPGMTGIELARMIKEKAPETVIVFISNYEDFNYVKGAMDIGAYDYILKHETRGTIFIEKLKKIKNYFEKHNQNKRNYIESKLILAFSYVGIPNLEQILPERYSLIIFEQASLLPPFMKLANTETQEIDENVYQSFFAKHAYDLVSGIRIMKYRYAVLLNPNCNVNAFINELCDYLYTQTKQRCYAMPLANDQPINTCLSEYIKHKDTINTKFFSKYDLIIHADKNLPVSSDHVIDTNKFIQTLTQTDIDKTCELLDYYSHIIIRKRDYYKLCHIVSVIIDFVSQYSNNSANKTFVFYNENDKNFWTNADEIFFWLKNKLIQLITCIKQDPIYSYSQPVKNAIDYISKNYGNSELSVGHISAHVGIDANKLNKMMKDETGFTTIKWMTNIRIEKAKELLMQDKKLTQIYSDIGYTNISYFSNVFKKVCGVTPLEYRRNKLEKDI